MKNLSSILNVILAIAVIYLYYLHLKSPEIAAVSTTKNENVKETAKVPLQPGEIKPSKIVYINADTLFEKYQYVKEIKKETNAKQSRMESVYKEKAQLLQQDYMEYQQKASQGMISQDQAKTTEEDLSKRKTELDKMEEQINLLMDETQKKNQEIQKEINDFLKEYNKTGEYNYILAYTTIGGSILYASENLDITKDVVRGLNERYLDKKKNKK